MKCGGIASVQAGPAPLAVGVDLARRVGEGRGPFAWVVTSPRPRYIETTVAMGFAVDDEVTALAGPAGLGETFLETERVDWAAGYAGMARLVREGGAFAGFAAEQADLWRSVAEDLPDDGCALVVTHGRACRTWTTMAGVPAQVTAKGRSCCLERFSPRRV